MINGTNASVLNTSNISASNRAAMTSRTPARIERPARVKAIPVKIVQKRPPSGIQAGTSVATSATWVRWVTPKSIEQRPNTQRAAWETVGHEEVRLGIDA